MSRNGGHCGVWCVKTRHAGAWPAEVWPEAAVMDWRVEAGFGAGLASNGGAWLGGPGTAGSGARWRVEARRDLATAGQAVMVGPDKTRRGHARRGYAGRSWRGATRRDSTRLGSLRRWHGRSGRSWSIQSWRGSACRGAARDGREAVEACRRMSWLRVARLSMTGLGGHGVADPDAVRRGLAWSDKAVRAGLVAAWLGAARRVASRRSRSRMAGRRKAWSVAVRPGGHGRACPDATWRGDPSPGKARRVSGRSGRSWNGRVRLGNPWPVGAGLGGRGDAMLGVSRHDWVRSVPAVVATHAKATPGNARLGRSCWGGRGKAGHGRARRGLAWLGLVWRSRRGGAPLGAATQGPSWRSRKGAARSGLAQRVVAVRSKARVSDRGSVRRWMFMEGDRQGGRGRTRPCGAWYGTACSGEPRRSGRHLS